MRRPFIVIGDKTTHGGSVISADFTSSIDGKYMARVNDMTVCPKCKGTFPITSGADDTIDEAGNAYARHMDTTACGAKLLSSQSRCIWHSQSQGDEEGQDAVASDAPAPAVPAAVAAQTPTLCLQCLVTAAARGESFV